MGKGRQRPALWILLFKGVTPKQLMALGYKKNTCYNYSAKMPEAKAEVKQKLKELKALKEKEVKTDGS